LDIITANNLFDIQVETPSYDAGTGNVLLYHFEAQALGVCWQ